MLRRPMAALGIFRGMLDLGGLDFACKTTVTAFGGRMG